MTFIFYDTETTGLEPAFHQILQFAAIVTDDQFKVLEEVNLRCRPRPHQLVSPGAMIVTKVGPKSIHDAPYSCYEITTEIRRFFERWSPAIVVGYNSISFDETMLRHMFFQGLQPVYQTNTNGNSRLDILRLAHSVAEHSPNAINVPLSELGRPIFRLGDLTRANGITLDGAHDALFDTRATLALAALLRERAPSIWDALLEGRSRHSVESFLQRNEVFYVTDRSFKKPTILAAAICSNPKNTAAVAVWDLDYHPDTYIDIDADAALRLLRASPRLIRVMRTNALPILLPVRDEDSSSAEMVIAKSRASLLRDHPSFRKAVSEALVSVSDEYPEPAFLEQTIYSGFPSRNDQTIMDLFHRLPWRDRYELLDRFDDKRFVELGERLIYAEFPEALPEHRRAAMIGWRIDRHSAEDAPWLTIRKATEELDAIKRDSSSEHNHLVEEIEEYLSKLREDLKS